MKNKTRFAAGIGPQRYERMLPRDGIQLATERDYLLESRLDRAVGLVLLMGFLVVCSVTVAEWLA